MRLQRVEVSGFRGFADERIFDVDADAVVIVGANGNGKTSFFDAVLWGISGRVPRISPDDWRLVNHFSESGQARVRLTLGAERGVSSLTVTRTFDGKESRLAVETHDAHLRGPEAQGKLIRTLWKDAAGAHDPSETLCNVLTRSVYLQQDLVRQFIESVSEQDRFLAVSELVGAGRITDLQAELERSKLAWTKFTNVRSAELEPIRVRLSSLMSRLEEIRARQSDNGEPFEEATWASWWGRVENSGVQGGEIPPLGPEAKVSLDSAIKSLDSLRRTLERRAERLEALQSDLERLKGFSVPDLNHLVKRLEAATAAVEQLRERVRQEQGRLSKVRSAQTALKEHAEQMKTLAAIALRNLGSHCPVCEQTYDVMETRRRLELMANVGVVEVAEYDESILHASLKELENAQAAELRLQMEVRHAQQLQASFESLRGFVEKAAGELGIGDLEDPQLLGEVISEIKRRILQAEAAQRDGELLSLRLSRLGDAGAVKELLGEIETLKLQLAAGDREVARRNKTGAKAQRIIEALRESASDVVADKISELQPLLTDMYSRVDVHPAFRIVKFLSSVVRGKGRLFTYVCDPQSNVEVDAPSTVLSSSQLNALAVCTFLSLNLGLSRAPLDSLLLDDPLQSLDDINLLGLIDLLRQAKDKRQLILSTHDVRFGVLLGRKLRPVSSSQRTVVIELDGWGRSGPEVNPREIASDPSPIRLRAVAS